MSRGVNLLVRLMAVVTARRRRCSLLLLLLLLLLPGRRRAAWVFVNRKHSGLGIRDAREPLLQLIVWGENDMMNAVIKGARITVKFLDDGAVAVHQAKLPELTSAAIQIQHAQLFTRHSEPLRPCGLTSPDIRSRREPAAARTKT